MTLFLDTSALLKRYVDEEGTAEVIDTMALDIDWAASAVARTETEVSLCRLIADDAQRDEVVARFRRDWARFFVVALDSECLDRAIEIGCERRLRTLDALHLAAVERLPPPLTMLSFDAQQIAAAVALGIQVGVEPRA